MKNGSSTRTIVATGLGAALFLVLFMFVKIPSPVPETNLQIAYGISGFFAALYGPVCGFLVAFIGHALNDFISYGFAMVELDHCVRPERSVHWLLL